MANFFPRVTSLFQTSLHQHKMVSGWVMLLGKLLAIYSNICFLRWKLGENVTNAEKVECDLGVNLHLVVGKGIYLYSVCVFITTNIDEHMNDTYY